MKTFTQEDLTDLTNWLTIICSVNEDEFIGHFQDLTEIVPMPIIGIARKRLKPSQIKRFDHLTDYSFCEREGVN